MCRIPSQTGIIFQHLKKIIFCLQPGVSIYLVWAYHSSDDAQASSFPQHSNDTRGVMQQTLIPAAITPTPTPGRNVHSTKENPTVNSRSDAA